MPDESARIPALVERPVIAAVVQQHAEEAAMLRHVRSVLVRAPHVALLHLGRLDERIAAHLDGLLVAGRAGRAMATAGLERAGAGEVFAAAALALQARDAPALEPLIALAQAVPDAWRGVASALGWVSAAELQGIVQRLLGAPDGARRGLGLSACRMHQVDPGPALDAALGHADPQLLTAALRTAGELGRLDLRERARALIGHEHPEVVFRAAWASCLLGDRNGALRVLEVAAQDDAPSSLAALSLAMAAASPAQAGEIARAFSRAANDEPASLPRRRALLRAIGLLGELRFVPWLIERMAEPDVARLAGEAFCWITGADLARMDLETLLAPPRPEHPSADPDDDDVSLDEDESLPWPDAARVQAWWEQQGAMRASGGVRLFRGQPFTPESARRTLIEGTQRQRAHAARLACALQPGQKLFPTAAPVPRQRRWLQ
jgi:uncharacterized protein (TIGR02270 family)